MRKRLYLLLLPALSLACGHTLTNKIGLMSFGDVQGKVLAPTAEMRSLEGSDCGYIYSLSNAARDALEGTSYDTLVDVDVTNTTGVFVPSNCIKVRGQALDSKQLSREGGAQ